MNTSSLLDIISGKQKGIWASCIRAGLRALVPVYRFAVNRRSARFGSGKNPVHNATVPVVSIGNITTGGTGKTPMVVWVCRLLQGHGVTAGIVSRGYGQIADGQTKNDEALELESGLPGVPHVQNSDRVAAASEIVRCHNVEAIVLDDGFQHRRLGRDIDIVLIDASNPFGYGYLLPRGLLREPLASLERADAVVITRSESVRREKLGEIRARIAALTSASIAISQTQTKSLLQVGSGESSLDSIGSKRCFAFSAIGNPAAFEKSLADNGINVCGTLRFRDHRWFTEADRDGIIQQAIDCEADLLICTHKDLVKIDASELGGLPVFAVLIEVAIVEGRHQLEKMILDATGWSAKA